MKFFKLLIYYCLYSSIICPIDIKELKDTHTILPDSNYAPFRGLVFLEEEINELWYTLCPIYQAKNIKQTLDLVRQYENISKEVDDLSDQMVKILTEEIKNNGTEDLIMQMFHIAGETFNIVQAPNNPIRQLEPKHIGQICRILSDSSDPSQLLDDPIYKAVLLDHIKTRQKLPKGDSSLSVSELKDKYQKFIKPKKPSSKDNIENSKTESAPAQEDPIIIQNYLHSKLLNYLENLKFKKASKSDFVSKDFKPFVTALVTCLQECAVSNPSKIYPENTTQGLLLSYMLAKANDKKDLQEYFRGFLHDDTFTLPIAQYTTDELKTISENKPDIQSIESIADYICALVYTTKYVSALPRIVANKTVAYQGNELPDCVETMMRMLVNIITYDAQNQKLGVTPAGLTLNSRLTVFYSNKINANPAQVKNTAVHRSWLKLVENQEGCSYNRLVVRGTQDVLEVRDLCDGVIPLETINTKLAKKDVTIADKNYTVFEQKVGTKTYWLVSSLGDLDCFELMPTLSNIIILLNKFFDLKLLNLAQRILNNLMSRNFGNEALEETFVEKYFEQMCKKLQWNVPQEIFDQIKTFKIAEDHSIEIPVTLPSDQTFTISIYDKAHGTIIVDQDAQAKDHITPEEFFTLDNATQAALLASKAVNYATTLESVPDLNRKPCNELYKCIDILNEDDRLAFINFLFSYKFEDTFMYSNDLTGHIYQDNAYLALLLASFSTELDAHYQNELIKKFAHNQDYTPLIVRMLNILSDSFYETDSVITGKALCCILQKNMDQMWNWLELGMQYNEQYLRDIALNFLNMILIWYPPLPISSEKIDLILSWIEKDMPDTELTENCIHLLFVLINNLHTLNTTEIQQATKLFKTAEDFLTSHEASWLHQTYPPANLDDIKQKLTPVETPKMDVAQSPMPTLLSRAEEHTGLLERRAKEKINTQNLNVLH